MNTHTVRLLSHPQDTIRTIFTACRTCYSNELPGDIWDKSDYIVSAFASGLGPISIEADKNKLAKMLELILKVIESGHHSTIEHCTYVFDISNVDRACTHQLVRHRHMSFSQKSQRYTSETPFQYYTPKEIIDKGFRHFYESHMAATNKFYQAMLDDGVKPETARMVLPNATLSSMVVSLNARELIHLANLRLCNNAQSEIRKVVKQMCELVIDKDPWLRDYLVPKCNRNMYCDEIRPCGKMITKTKVAALIKSINESEEARTFIEKL